MTVTTTDRKAGPDCSDERQANLRSTNKTSIKWIKEETLPTVYQSVLPKRVIGGSPDHQDYRDPKDSRGSQGWRVSQVLQEQKGTRGRLDLEVLREIGGKLDLQDFLV